jgi:hypothetical protein
MGLAGLIHGARRKAMQSISDDERRSRCPTTPMRPEDCDSAAASPALVLLDDDSGIAAVGPPCICRPGVATRAPHSISTTR